MMRIGSLFTGFGGLDLAVAQVLPVEHAWVADNDPAAVRVLAHHWPDVPNLDDITRVDWGSVEPVDVLTGGFPCQDISNAGRREGISGARSSLWGCYVDAIRVLRPRYVFVENVASLVVRGLDRVLADLAALGLDAEWTVTPAFAIGAPHRRERLFLIATDSGREHGDRWAYTIHGGVSCWLAPDELERSAKIAANPDSFGSVRTGRTRGRRDGPAHHDRIAANPEHGSKPEWARPSRRASEQRAPEWRGPGSSSTPTNWGRYAPAIRAWERILGRAAPVPTIRGARGGRVLNPALAEWMMGLPDGWITDVPGLSRNDMLKLAGNGVVPAQAAAAYRRLLPLLEAEGVAA